MNERAIENPQSPLSPWVLNRQLLMRLCLRWTRGNQQEAEDLLGDAYLRALEGEQKALVQCPLSYSATIIANLARDRLRTRHPHEALGDVDSTRWPACHASSPDELASTRESLQRALRVLEAVPSRQRSALLLRSLGNDYSRIASAVGTTQAHARKLVQFARAAVQALE